MPTSMSRTRLISRSCRESAARVVDWCGWQRIRCDRDGRIRSIQDIHQEVLERGGSAAVKDGTPQRPVPVRPNPMVRVCPYVLSRSSGSRRRSSARSVRRRSSRAPVKR